jgi:hypothetical protein
MDRKQSVVANVRYQPAAERGMKRLKGLLRYVQYRDDRDGHISQKEGLKRWTDKGLGHNFQTIAARCDELKSAHVQAFTWVINPNPDLMALLPEHQREAFVRELTETTLDTFFEARGLETPEYAYAIHRRITIDETQPGRDNPHAHVILAGSYDSWADGGRLPLYMNRNKRENHIDLLHTVAQQQIEHLLAREVGLDWEQQYDRLMAAREQPTASISDSELEGEKPAASQPPHGFVKDEAGNLWQARIATRAVNPAVSQVGLILTPADPAAATDQHFVALVESLTATQASHLGQQLLSITHKDPEKGWESALQWAEQLQAMDPGLRNNLLDEPTQGPESTLSSEIPDRTRPGPDLDL